MLPEEDSARAAAMPTHHSSIGFVEQPTDPYYEEAKADVPPRHMQG